MAQQSQGLFDGRILLVNQDDAPICTVKLTATKRPLNVMTDHGQFHATRRLDNGMWVYRWFGEKGTRPSHPGLKDYRDKNHRRWDGPGEPPQPTDWSDVQKHFQRVLQASMTDEGKVSAPDITELYRHVQALFENQPYFPETIA